MRETIHTKNTFRTGDTKAIQQVVTEKIQKLLNQQIRKEG